MPVIYSITNKINGKRYIGKTVNSDRRWWTHKWNMKRKSRNKKSINNYLFNAAKKYGVENFIFEILETVENPKEKEMRVRELWWMDFYQTCDRNHGYNLRRDSATQCFMPEETKKLMSEAQAGENNGNFGNHWTDEQKEKMAQIAINRHKSGKYYTKEWRNLIGKSASKMWENVEKKNTMALKVKIKKRKYFFDQFTKEGLFLKRWDNVDDIIEQNPGWKWQNVYSACNGYKPTYHNFVWKKVNRNEQSSD